jgi:hypothetical protein
MPNAIEVVVVVCAEAVEASLVSERKANEDLLERVANQGIIEGHSEVDIEAEKDIPLEVALMAEKEVAIMADVLLKDIIVMIDMKTKTVVTTIEADVEAEAEAEAEVEDEAEADEFRYPALPKNAWINETYSKASAQNLTHND